MALRSLMLKKKIDKARESLEAATEKRASLQTREAELEQSIEEAETEEEKAAVEEAVAEFENEKAENEAEVSKFDEELRALEAELAEEEKRQSKTTVATPQKTEPKDTREEKKVTMSRKKFFGMNHEERDAFLNNEEVKGFLARTREMIKERRSVTGAQLLIPTVVLDLIRENITEYSKLIKHVRLMSVAGKARQTVQGIIPEAVWTEMCGKLNELAVSFTGVEVDGYKVGGYVPVCNA